jgi:hypothetical protein
MGAFLSRRGPGANPGCRGYFCRVSALRVILLLTVQAHEGFFVKTALAELRRQGGKSTSSSGGAPTTAKQVLEQEQLLLEDVSCAALGFLVAPFAGNMDSPL